MKKLALFFFLLLTACTLLSAKNKVITNPVYEFKTSGILNVSKIEWKPNEVRVHIHSTFIPHWWVNFSNKDFIQDCDTGEKYYATDIENGEFNKEIYMPASGDSTFILIFPKPKNKKIKKINFGENEEAVIFGISLNPKEKPTTRKTTPPHVLEWIEKEMAKAERQTLIDLNSEKFFSKDPARIIGFINGYDPRAGFSTGIIYYENELTGEDYPTVVQVHPDGRFEATLPMIHPTMGNIYFKNESIDFYVEPGQTLALILDWEDFLNADRYRDRRCNFNKQYFGAAAQINREVSFIKSELKEFPYSHIYKEAERMNHEEYKTFQKPYVEEYHTTLNRLLNEKTLTEHTQMIMKSNLAVECALFLLAYDMINSSKKYQDKTPFVAPAGFYDFLHDVPMNDQTLLISTHFSTFINRFEYCTPFEASYHVYEQPKDTIERMSNSEIETERWRIKDSIYTDVLKLQPSIVYDIAKVRSLKFLFTTIEIKEEARAFLTQLKKGIAHPFLIKEAERIFNEAYPDSEIISYELPPGKGSEIFKKIVDPFKGKIVFVDFWGIFCGPCVHSIKNQKDIREKYKDSEDAAFIFITSDKESPLDRYDKFIEEQELINTYRLSGDDFLYLRQLFKFNGIPRYVMVDRDGRILDDNFPMHNFEYKLQKKLEAEKSSQETIGK